MSGLIGLLDVGALPKPIDTGTEHWYGQRRKEKVSKKHLEEKSGGGQLFCSLEMLLPFVAGGKN